MQNIKVGILGGAGYTGGELTRLLLHHPNVTISFIHSRSNAGKTIGTIHTDLYDLNELKFSAAYHFDVDVLFMCLGHGESSKFLAENTLPQQVKIIDLGNDFRVQRTSPDGTRDFVYGLPEIHKSQIKNSNSIANPGCFATAIQLGLLPLAAHIDLSDVYITGITGSTGAGQSLSNTSHFSWRANNIQPYKTLTHQHLDEMVASLNEYNPNISKQNIHFVPWRGDFPRGIFTSIQVANSLPIEDIYSLFEQFYKEHPFTIVSRAPIHLKQVINTNKCFIHIEGDQEQLVIHTAIDNLLKGATGQAVQNMNIMFGLDESTGLQLKPSFF